MISLNVPDYLIKWTKSFLDNRSFKINVDGALSDPGQIICGCPQGAILSPLLFNIFINDVPVENQIRKSFSLLFADDLSTSFYYKTKATFTKKASLYLKKIESWSFKWRLKMNTSKSNYTVFGTLKLGEKTLINSYRCLIGSVMDYNFFILPFVSVQNLNKLQAIQNKAIRCIFRLTFNKDTGKHTSTETLNNLSGLGSIASRLTELKKNYLKQAQETQNPLICPLIEEYINSRSEIEREGSSPSILTVVEKIT
jgi:hypothetical protein